MSVTTAHGRTSKLVLAVGFIGVLAGTLAAFRNPSTGYELSVYASTPMVFWIGIAVALATSLLVAFLRAETPAVRSLALLLGGLAVLTVVLLPLVRGYYQFGGADSLTHLGWTRDIVAGRLAPVDLLYPGIHLMTIFTSEIVALPLTHAQYLATAAFVPVFVLFVALCVRVMGQTSLALPAGVFSALLLVPNNNIGVHLMAHPLTQFLLFFPLTLYLVVMYVQRRGESPTGNSTVTPTGGLFTVMAVAAVLIHPQGAITLAAVLITIVVVQFILTRVNAGGVGIRDRMLYVPTIATLLALAVWIPRHPRVHRTIDSVVSGLLSGTVPADEIAQRSSSLSVLGGSIPELFTKLFGVAAIFCVFTGLLLVGWYMGWLDDRAPELNGLVPYFGLVLVPPIAAFGLFFAASHTTQHFRFLGILMVPVTILGALAISEGATHLKRILGRPPVRVGLVLLFLVLFPLSVATLHASPVIYQSNPQVTEAQLDGTKVTVETMDTDVPFAGLRSGPRRQLHGVFGTEGAKSLNVSGERSGIPGPVFNSNLSSHFDSPRYVPVSETDYQREVVLYEGFRYSQEGFERLQTEPGIDRVHTNGEYRLYLVGESSAT